MHFNLNECVISENESIRNALLRIEKNSLGMVMSYDVNGKTVGVLTDGDIRRGLLAGLDLDSCVESCANSNFIFASKETSREQLIKILDGQIKYIPILDDTGTLTSIVSKNHLPLDKEKPIYIRARAPVRMSFGGGGSDLTHYFTNKAGAVINTAISIYSHATMKVRDDKKL
jgi:D-glycero-alpha-D-manno-heptose-7-phosphate kinase